MIATSKKLCYNILMNLEIFQQLGVAVLLSTLIGLEREHKSQIYKYQDFGGIRTLILIGLAGAMSFYLSDYSYWFFGLIAAGVIGLMVLAYYMMNKKYGSVGMTSEIAAILVFIIGILSAKGEFILATTVALITVSVLHFKSPLHLWAKRVKSEELVSTIEFIIIAFIVLPLLPNKSIGPYGFFNPYVVWLMVVFISGISFASYVAIKLWGQRKGIGITGFLAGFLSSTALTLSFSGESKKNREIINPYAFAVIIASTAMFFRVYIEVLVINPELLANLSIPILVMGATGLLAVLFFWFKKEKTPEKMQKRITRVQSPFSLKPALKFGLFFAAVLFFTKYAGTTFGDRGVYLTSIVSGILDVDAITVSMANLAKSDIAPDTAGNAVVLAAMTNTFVKGFIFTLFGNFKVAIRIILSFAAIIFSGILTMVLF